MRAAIHVALAIVSAGVSIGVAQRRGAFIAGPPYAGRPPVAAVAGTPGAALWNPGSPSTRPCCTNPNGNWMGRAGHRQRGPEILAVPVPIPMGEEVDPQPIAPEQDEQANQPPPDPQPPPITIVLQPAAPAPTAATVGPAAAPAPRSTERAKPDPPHVLIALNDGWVYAAIAYWVDRDTLHYVTTSGAHNQVSLSLIDRKISERLNRTSQMALVLP